MIGSFVDGLVMGLHAAIAEHKAFEAEIALLPKDLADAKRAEKRLEQEKLQEHRRAIEVAEAGRARNFWGE